MANATHCPACGEANAIAAEACASCGEPLPAGEIPVHPGETFRDPDDLSFSELPPGRTRLRALERPSPAPPAAPSPGAPSTLPAATSPAAPTTAATATTTSSEPALTPAQFITRPQPPPASVPETPPPRARVPAPSARDDGAEAAALREMAERMAYRRAAAERRSVAVVGAARPAHYAGFVIRLVAFAIDVVVLCVFTVPVAIAAVYGVEFGLAASRTSVGFLDTQEALARLVGLAWLATAAIYFTVLHSDPGQTIGKAIVGIAVRRARNLAGIGIVRSLVRFVAYAPSFAVLLLGALTIMLSPRKRGWHDYLAGTCVVHLAPEEL